ncbi:hypothetical protein OIU79_003945 [Salix purpurea]|uniref:Uncharacterized protein n=1 Tax=Salix purpurea TaxID=77065 RepID=A0A9Q0U904_SALPP|nr:hypothetical protein OIU79_003945 [Salix purpurea]
MNIYIYITRIKMKVGFILKKNPKNLLSTITQHMELWIPPLKCFSVILDADSFKLLVFSLQQFKMTNRMIRKLLKTGGVKYWKQAQITTNSKKIE